MPQNDLLQLMKKECFDFHFVFIWKKDNWTRDSFASINFLALVDGRLIFLKTLKPGMVLALYIIIKFAFKVDRWTVEFKTLLKRGFLVNLLFQNRPIISSLRANALNRIENSIKIPPPKVVGSYFQEPNPSSSSLLITLPSFRPFVTPAFCCPAGCLFDVPISKDWDLNKPHHCTFHQHNYHHHPFMRTAVLLGWWWWRCSCICHAAIGACSSVR